jgi:hypothetical protein
MDFYTLALFPLLTTLYILSYYAMFVSMLECNDLDVIMKYVDANNQEMEGLRHE